MRLSFLHPLLVRSGHVESTGVQYSLNWTRPRNPGLLFIISTRFGPCRIEGERVTLHTIISTLLMSINDQTRQREDILSLELLVQFLLEPSGPLYAFVQTTLRTRRLLWGAGTFLRMSGGRLPKRIMFGNLEGAVRRGQDGKKKEWTDCVQSDIRAFGITGNRKTMAVKAEGWVEAVTEGGRRFKAAWRQEEEDAARHRQEKREATRLGKLQSHTEA